MLGKNLTLSYFIQDPQFSNAPFLGIPALGTIGSIHVDTIALTILCMSIILVTAAVVRPGLTGESAGGNGQALLEMFYGFIEEITKGQMGSAYKKFFPLIAAIFIFVLIGNFIGVGPWKALENLPSWPKLADGEAFEVASPTTDFNVTFALALIALLTYIGSGFWAHGAKHLKTYFGPFFLIEWMDVVIRPATLALRLMMVGHGALAFAHFCHGL
jgi:F-type H+-transporting ATPase subunit a